MAGAYKELQEMTFDVCSSAGRSLSEFEVNTAGDNICTLLQTVPRAVHNLLSNHPEGGKATVVQMTLLNLDTVGCEDSPSAVGRHPSVCFT